MAGDNLRREDIQEALEYGQCHFGKELGEGSYGKVVLATDKVTQRHYAVKMMICDSEERIKYQKRELDLPTNQEISNRNIIRYYNSWPVPQVGNKIIFCVKMELCWLSLDKLLLRDPSIVKDGNFYQHIFPQILNGLNVIHSIGWIHRDIHPGNILIANPKPSEIKDTVIKIADFGLARHVGSSSGLSNKSALNRLSENVGNWLFRAPEMSTSCYNHKADLYSAGLILYVLCCFLENANLWVQEIEEVRRGNRTKDNLYHNDEMLVKLLNGLLKENPEERPSARAALERFPNKNIDCVDAPVSNSPVPFLVREEKEDSYDRCKSPDKTISGIKQAIQERRGINKEDQELHQECNDKGGKYLVNVTCDEDVRDMLRSAERAGCKVRLIVSKKETPRNVATNEI